MADDFSGLGSPAVMIARGDATVDLAQVNPAVHVGVSGRIHGVVFGVTL